ncbi:BON domain-containing protein [Paraburkholderia solisilvae]|nr:BON domain-containing protein [Paraburkholderia solisilvae]
MRDAPQIKRRLVIVAALALPAFVYRGVVQLSGYLDSEPQIQKALVVTRCVPGVRSVSNDLHLRPQQCARAENR